MQNKLSVTLLSMLISSVVFVPSLSSGAVELTPTLKDFASLPRLMAPALSPTGKYLSALVNVEDKQLLLVRDLDHLAGKPYLISGANWKIRRHIWVSPHDLLLGISLPETVMGMPLVVTRLIHVDVKKQKQRLLFKREKSEGFFSDARSSHCSASK